MFFLLLLFRLPVCTIVHKVLYVQEILLLIVYMKSQWFLSHTMRLVLLLPEDGNQHILKL